MAQAFGEPAFPVDTHIHRLARALGAVGRHASSRAPSATSSASSRASRGTRLHLQIIYFGRQYCPARGHDSSRVPDLLVGGIEGADQAEMAKSQRRVHRSSTEA